MDPSSLIFLVIIGIWGAYFVQYWVRRREHLSTIRSVDAFSETMRVLQVRAPLPSVDSGAGVPRSSSVSPARTLRPQVTVKRAEAYAASPAAAPAASSSSGASPQRDEPPVPTMSPSRATRGVVLLVGLVGTPVFGVLAAVGVLVAWSFVVPMLMAVAGFVWLRAGVQAEARARRVARGRARRAADRAAPAARPSAAERASSAPRADVRSDVQEAPADEVSEPAAPVESAPAAAPYDVSAQSPAQPPAEPRVAAQPEVAVVELDEDDIPLTWDPRPVPRPTYTMKARAAQRPAPQPEPAAAPVRAAYDDELPQRRIAGG